MNAITRFYPGDEAALFAVNVLAQVTMAGLLVWLGARIVAEGERATHHGVSLAALAWILLSPLAAYVCRNAGVVFVAIPVVEAQIPAQPKRVLEAPSEEGPDTVPAVTESRVTEAAVPQPTEKSPDSAPGLVNSLPAPTLGLSWGEMLRLAVTVAGLLWGVGMLYFLARLIHGLTMLASLRRKVQPIDDERLDDIRAQVCQALGVADLPPIVASPWVGSPIAVGVGRPMVVLPAGLVDVLDSRQLREVLIHECAHVLRRDHVVGLLQRVAEMLFWPHPLVHLLNRELAQAREEVCDNHVLLASNGPDYARTLLALAECATHYHYTPATSGLLGSRWRLEDRVAGLLNQGRKCMIRMNRFQAAAVAVVFMATALAIAGTRLIGASDPHLPTVNTKEVAPSDPVSFVPVKPDTKGENPMPPISEAVVRDGLSITLAPAKAVFIGKEPLGFAVTLKNVSKEPFMLFDADWDMSYMLEIRNPALDGPWLPSTTWEVQRVPAAASQSKVLQPGAALEIKLLPPSKFGEYVYAYGGSQNMLPRPLPYLAPGKYTVRARRSFAMNPVLFNWPHKHWLGNLSTNPVEFTVAAEKPAGGAVNDKSLPDTLNGLSITVKPAKTAFVLKEQLSFTVSFKNVSKKTLLLYDIDETMGYKVEFNGFPAGGLWVPGYNLNHSKVKEAPKASDSKALAPGQTLDQLVVMNGVTYDYRGPQLASPIAKDYLDAGKYRVTVGFKGVLNPAKVEWKDEHWIGEIAAKSTDFTIGAVNSTNATIVVKGLSVAAITDHRVFPGNVIPHFKVRFENVSGKDFSLFGYQSPNWTLHIKNKANGIMQTWKHVPRAAAPAMAQLVLAAGKSHEEEVVLHPKSFFIPPKNDAAAAIGPGKYELVFEIDLRESPFARAIVPAFWVGQVRTAPLEFTVGDGAAKEP